MLFMSSPLRKALIFGFLGIVCLILYYVKSNSILNEEYNLALTSDVGSSKRLAIVGHSFIARLKPEQFQEYDNLKIYGLNGAKAGNFMNKTFFIDMLEYKPDFCFVQVGGNDIIHGGKNAEGILFHISNIIKLLKFKGIYVVIGEIMPRSKARPPMILEEYNHIRDRINYLLREDYDNILVKHDTIDTSLLLEDGVHLNEEGTKIFVNTIKKSIDQYLNEF